ncbi:hypothetical protein FNV43_RR24271 [Rhamnella rubrinervis]|uniref:RNA polymerase III RPC4 n=1 Tax=Rhamnella rubrinervis TaxID=2594499 RepID=A0A8K0DRY3_9ROSA|nr:hypothetical protein FNV43_RR24271 [Rhamnella rubrinervis]
MEQDESSNTRTTRRKVRFIPKAQPRRKLDAAPAKTEAVDEDEARQAQSLLRQFNENHRRTKTRAGRKSSLQVAFGPGAPSSSSLRTFGVAKDGNSSKSSGIGLKGSEASDNEQASLPLFSSGAETDTAMEEVTDLSIQTSKKNYREPWDYHHSYYPTVLPLRQPYSGNPELLNEEEFGEAARNTEYDDTTINSTSELGLSEENEERKMFFFHLPNTLPMVKQSASRKSEKVGSSVSSQGTDASSRGGKLEELPGGHMGKMLVYKSGAIKLKLGHTLYDVSPGSDCTFSQDVVAINTSDKECCVLGELRKRVVVAPDVDSLLNAVINLD